MEEVEVKHDLIGHPGYSCRTIYRQWGVVGKSGVEDSRWEDEVWGNHCRDSEDEQILSTRPSQTKKSVWDAAGERVDFLQQFNLCAHQPWLTAKYMQECLRTHTCHERRPPSVNWGWILIPLACVQVGIITLQTKNTEEKDLMPVCKLRVV